MDILLNLPFEIMPIIKVQEETAGKIAGMLLQIQAIKLNTEKPFSWSSGWKSPIYCDNRLSLSYPHNKEYNQECIGTSHT